MYLHDKINSKSFIHSFIHFISKNCFVFRSFSLFALCWLFICAGWLNVNACVSFSRRLSHLQSYPLNLVEHRNSIQHYLSVASFQYNLSLSLSPPARFSFCLVVIFGMIHIRNNRKCLLSECHCYSVEVLLLKNANTKCCCCCCTPNTLP